MVTRILDAVRPTLQVARKMTAEGFVRRAMKWDGTACSNSKALAAQLFCNLMFDKPARADCAFNQGGLDHIVKVARSVRGRVSSHSERQNRERVLFYAGKALSGLTEVRTPGGVVQCPRHGLDVSYSTPAVAPPTSTVRVSQNETVVERASMREDLMEVVAQLSKSTYPGAPDKAARVLYRMMHAPGAADKAMRSPVRTSGCPSPPSALRAAR